MARVVSKHWKSLTLICLVCTGLGLAAQLMAVIGRGWVPWQHIEFSVQDFIARHGKRSLQNPQIVFLAIDYPSVSLDPVNNEEIAASPALTAMKNSGWPWTRDVYAPIIERLVGAGAVAVAFDLLFPTPRPGDEELRAALERYRDRAVIGGNVVDADRAESSTAFNRPAPTIVPSDGSLETCVGFVNMPTDLDEVVRRVIYRGTLLGFSNKVPPSDSPVIYSLAARALQKASRSDAIPPGVDRRFRIRFADEFVAHSIYEIFVPGFWETNFQNGAFFKNKIVFVGPEGNWSKDFIRMPFADVAGVQMHLNAANAALNHDFLQEAPAWVNFVVIVAFGTVAWAVSAMIARPLLRLALLIGFTAAFYVALQVLYNTTGLCGVPVLLPLFALDGSGFAFLAWERVKETAEKRRVRRTLERYVSKNVVKEILDNPESYLHDLGGTRKGMAILITDLRDFTTISESADSSKLVAQLNEYFSEMVRHVFENKGSLDKFIGDAILAVWGNVRSEGAAHDAELAITTALRMLQSLRKLNADWRSRGMIEFGMGVGVNYGDAIFGNIGSNEKMEPTVIGDPVNLASRLEGLTKEYGQELCVGESAAELVRDKFHFQLLDYVKVKGKTKPINVYTVLGSRDEPLSAEMTQYLQSYDAALQCYREGKFEQAMELFSICLDIRKGDFLAAMYLERCEDLKREQPAKWDGVFVMTKK